LGREKQRRIADADIEDALARGQAPDGIGVLLARRFRQEPAHEVFARRILFKEPPQRTVVDAQLVGFEFRLQPGTHGVGDAMNHIEYR